MQSDRWIEECDFRSETKSGMHTVKKSAFSIPTFSIEQSDPHTLSKSRLFQRDARIGLLDRKSFRSPPHLPPHLSPLHKDTITPCNSSDAGMTATFAAAAAAAAAAAHSESAWHIVFSRQQRVPSSDGSSACYRRPFCNTTAAAVLALATLGEVQGYNRDDEADEGSPRAKRALCSRKRRDKGVCLSTASSLVQTPRTREQDTKQFSTSACSSPAYQTPPERAQIKFKKLQTRSN